MSVASIRKLFGFKRERNNESIERAAVSASGVFRRFLATHCWWESCRFAPEVWRYKRIRAIRCWHRFNWRKRRQQLHIAKGPGCLDFRRRKKIYNTEVEHASAWIRPQDDFVSILSMYPSISRSAYQRRAHILLNVAVRSVITLCLLGFIPTKIPKSLYTCSFRVYLYFAQHSTASPVVEHSF